MLNNKKMRSYKELIFLSKLVGVDTSKMSSKAILRMVGPDFNKQYVLRKLKELALPYQRNVYSQPRQSAQFISKLRTLKTENLTVAEIVRKHAPVEMNFDYACRLVRKNQILHKVASGGGMCKDKLVSLMTSIETLHEAGIPVTRRAIAKLEHVSAQRISEKYAAYGDVIESHKEQKRLASTLRSLDTESMTLTELMNASCSGFTIKRFKSFLDRYGIPYRPDEKVTSTSLFREALQGLNLDEMHPDEICRLYAPPGLSHASAKAYLYKENLITRKQPGKGSGRIKLKERRLDQAFKAVLELEKSQCFPSIRAIAQRTGMTVSSLYKYPELKRYITNH